VEGYTDKLESFLKDFWALFESVVKGDTSIGKEIIENAIEKQTKVFKNLNVDSDERANNARLCFMLEDKYDADTILDELDELHPPEVQKFIVSFYEKPKIVALVCGNVTEEHALKLGSIIEGKNREVSTAAVELETGETVRWDYAEESDSEDGEEGGEEEENSFV